MSTAPLPVGGPVRAPVDFRTVPNDVQRRAEPGGPTLGRGERVFIRHPLSTDEHELLALRRASWELLRPWEPTLPDGIEPCGPSWFHMFLRTRSDERHERMLVCLRGAGTIVGVFSLNQIVRGPLQSAFLGYWVGVGHSGRGYMSEGLQLALRHAFRMLRLHRVEANIQPGNHTSISLVERAGFRREGVSTRYLNIGGRWRDHERWALLREDWSENGNGG